jgi:hypothetical protein
MGIDLHPERCIAIFNRCLRLYDKNRASLEGQKKDLMWYYKWVVSRVAEFADIKVEAIHRMFDDMEKRYAACGYNFRAIHDLRLAVAVDMGHMKEAATHFEAWKATPRDASADCEACEYNAEVWYHFANDRDDDAFRAAEEILRRRLRCNEVPAGTYAHMMVPLARRGDVIGAARCQRKSRRLMRADKPDLGTAGSHLLFCAATDQVRTGTGLLQHGMKIVMTHKSHLRQFTYLSGVRVFLRRLSQLGLRHVSVALPDGIAERDAHGYRVDAVLAWAESRCDTLATQLDTRNGNTYRRKELAKDLELLTVAQPLPWPTRWFHR